MLLSGCLMTAARSGVEAGKAGGALRQSETYEGGAPQTNGRRLTEASSLGDGSYAEAISHRSMFDSDNEYRSVKGEQAPCNTYMKQMCKLHRPLRDG